MRQPTELHKPRCHNHPPPHKWHTVQDGWGISEESELQPYEVEDRSRPVYKVLMFRNSKGCAVINSGEASYHGFDCQGCFWSKLPLDPSWEQIEEAFKSVQTV